jgi:hypothetical protein
MHWHPQSGLDVDAAGAATKAWVKAGIDAAAINLDQAVGHAGEAMPWLALACAVKAVAIDSTAQLVAAGSTSGSQFSVVRGTKVGDENQAAEDLPQARPLS